MTTKQWVKFSAALVGGGIVLIVVFQNLQPVTFRVLFWNPSVPPVILLLVTFAAGFALSWIVSSLPGRKRRQKGG